MRPPAVLNWSGGKDATLALYRLSQQNASPRVQCLFTTLGEEQRRVTMHGVQEVLLQAQAQALGLPLHCCYLPTGVDMPTYSRLMEAETHALLQQGIRHSVFGDIHLEDLRQYREEALSKVGMTAVFPLWQEPVEQLAQEFIQLGFKAVVVCVNARVLDSSFVGRRYDASFLADLPAGVDPCGEHGEFHTFVYDGLFFRLQCVSKKEWWCIGTIPRKERSCLTIQGFISKSCCR